MKNLKKISINIVSCGAVFGLCIWMKSQPSTTCIEAGGAFDHATGYCRGLSSSTQFYEILNNEFRFLLFFGLLLSTLLTVMIWKNNKSSLLQPKLKMNADIKKKKVEKIEKIVNEVFKNSSDLLHLMDTWPLPNEEALRHILDHYIADQDIRSKENEYEEFQKQEVLKVYKEFLDSNN